MGARTHTHTLTEKEKWFSEAKNRPGEATTKHTDPCLEATTTETWFLHPLWAGRIPQGPQVCMVT